MFRCLQHKNKANNNNMQSKKKEYSLDTKMEEGKLDIKNNRTSNQLRAQKKQQCSVEILTRHKHRKLTSPEAGCELMTKLLLICAQGTRAYRVFKSNANP